MCLVPATASMTVCSLVPGISGAAPNNREKWREDERKDTLTPPQRDLGPRWTGEPDSSTRWGGTPPNRPQMEHFGRSGLPSAGTERWVPAGGRGRGRLPAAPPAGGERWMGHERGGGGSNWGAPGEDAGLRGQPRERWDGSGDREHGTHGDRWRGNAGGGMRDGPGFGPSLGEPHRDHAGRGRGFMSGRGRLHGPNGLAPGAPDRWGPGGAPPGPASEVVPSKRGGTPPLGKGRAMLVYDKAKMIMLYSFLQSSGDLKMPAGLDQSDPGLLAVPGQPTALETLLGMPYKPPSADTHAQGGAGKGPHAESVEKNTAAGTEHPPNGATAPKADESSPPERQQPAESPFAAASREDPPDAAAGAAGAPPAAGAPLILSDAWVYKDPNGQLQGPFSKSDILDWYDMQYFPSDLQVKHASQPDGTFEDVTKHIQRWALEAKQAQPQPGQDPSGTVTPQEQPQPLHQPSLSVGQGLEPAPSNTTPHFGPASAASTRLDAAETGMSPLAAGADQRRFGQAGMSDLGGVGASLTQQHAEQQHLRQLLPPHHQQQQSDIHRLLGLPPGAPVPGGSGQQGASPQQHLPTSFHTLQQVEQEMARGNSSSLSGHGSSGLLGSLGHRIQGGHMGGHAAEVPGRVQEGFHLAPQAHGLLPQQLGHQQQQPGQGLPFQRQQMHHGQQHGLHQPQEQHGVLMHQQHQHLAQPHGLHQQMPPPMHFLQGISISQRPQGHAPQQSIFPGHHPQQHDALHGALSQGQGLRYHPEPVPSVHQSRMPGYHGQEREQAVGQHMWSQTPQASVPQPQQVPSSSGWEAPAAFSDARASADLSHSQPEGLLRGNMSSELQQQVHPSQPAPMHMGKGLQSQGLGLGVHAPEQPPQQKAPGPSRAEAQPQPQHKKPQQEEYEWQEVAAQLQPVPQVQQKPDPIAAPKRSAPGGPVGPMAPVSRPAPAAASKPAEDAGRPWGPAPTVQDFTERMFGGQGDSSQTLQAQPESKVAPWAGSKQGGPGDAKSLVDIQKEEAARAAAQSAAQPPPPPPAAPQLAGWARATAAPMPSADLREIQEEQERRAGRSEQEVQEEELQRQRELVQQARAQLKEEAAVKATPPARQQPSMAIRAPSMATSLSANIDDDMLYDYGGATVPSLLQHASSNTAARPPPPPGARPSQVPNGRVAAPAGGPAPQLAPQQQRPKGCPSGAAAAAASADDAQMGDVPKLSPVFEEWCRGQMQTLLNTSELTFPYYLMTLEGRNLLDEAVLANLRGTTTEAQRRAFTSEFFRSAAAL
eukprot:jgi/Astpho2/8921/fgenesh1_pg.00133_%23_4_t